MGKIKLHHIALLAAPLALTACELAPKTTEQDGYRGTGMNAVYVSDSRMPGDVPPPPYELVVAEDGPRPSEVYENVQVLGNLSADEFNYLMAAITEWVAPEQGCNYCHNPANMASDELYTKGVARSMLLMTQDVNQNWQSHVAATGVTCWTCHRGNNIPQEVWTLPEPENAGSIANNRRGQNTPIAANGYSSLPYGAVARYLLDGSSAEGIRVASTGMHPGDNATTTMESEATYSLMMHMSQSLGVNCTFCHNTQSFSSWSNSTPQRTTAWHGIRMAGSINETYITPLTDVFPANRLGPMGDPYKVNCTTCHQGLNRPMGGARMVADYPGLQRLLISNDASDAVEVEAVPATEMTDTN